jgi:uncharacterized protein (DUF2237 family)
MRWLEAKKAGAAPKVDLEATNAKVLSLYSLSLLAEHAIDEDQKQIA